MRRSLLTGVAVVAAAGAFVAMGAPDALASERGGHGRWEHQQVVDVRGDGSAAHLSTTHLHAGSIQFRVHTTNPTTPDGGGSQIGMFKLKNGADLPKVFGDLAEEFGADPAKGTRDLVHDASFYGLADVSTATPATVTESLSPGTYYLVDLGKQPSGPPAVATLTVDGKRAGIEQDSDLRSQVTVKAVDPDRFVAPRKWPHQGTFTFTNRSDTIHFASLEPVKAGTTDKQVQAYFDSHSDQPPPFLDPSRPSTGSDVLSPGKSLQLSYSLPKGTYVLLCFVADDETGMPHALMGMHEVVVLK
jgi:hypothetical protein